MIFIFPIGMPLFSLYLLYLKRGKLDPGQERIEDEHAKRHDSTKEDALREAAMKREELEAIKHLSCLYESYQPKYWW